MEKSKYYEIGLFAKFNLDHTPAYVRERFPPNYINCYSSDERSKYKHNEQLEYHFIAFVK